jgi:two-component system chemotaxis response regulator CheY
MVKPLLKSSAVALDMVKLVRAMMSVGLSKEVLRLSLQDGTGLTNPGGGMSVDRKTTVLVVDDEWLVIEIITSLLKRGGFENVDFASDGASALAQMRQKAYGLVISDLNMDGMNGLKLVRAVRQDPQLHATPFILTTASPVIENAVAAKQAGVDLFLLKPFTADVLKQKVYAALSRGANMSASVGSAASSKTAA